LQYNRIALVESHTDTWVIRGQTSDPELPKSATLKNNTVDVVGLGLNAMDTICIVPSFPQPNTKTAMLEVRLEPGDQVATALTTCVRLGLTARYIGSVGTDNCGKAQLASLREENLELNIREVE